MMVTSWGKRDVGLRSVMVEVLETWVGPKSTLMTTIRGGPQIAQGESQAEKAQDRHQGALGAER